MCLDLVSLKLGFSMFFADGPFCFRFVCWFDRRPASSLSCFVLFDCPFR